MRRCLPILGICVVLMSFGDAKAQESSVHSALIYSTDQQQATVERYRGGIVPQTLDLLRKTQVGFAQGASSYLEVLSEFAVSQ